MNRFRFRNAPLRVFAALLLLVPAAAALGSSHREAPGISKDPVADNTDVYFFVDPADPSRVVLIANWIPLEEPAGGPNFSHFGEDIRYEFNIDSDGDAMEDIVYRLQFTRHVQNTNTFLQNTGPVGSNPADPNQNVYYTYSLMKCAGPSPNQTLCATLGSDLVEAPNYPGPKSFPNGYHFAPYPVDDDTLVFAGPRSDPFFVDLGMVFDLVNFRPGTLPGNHGGGTNSLAGYNVHSIALSIPIAQLTKNGSTPTDPTDPNAVLSMWSSTWRRQTTTLQSNGSVPVGTGAWVQVSRLANPLVNEVIIPLGLKDQFNATYPYADLANYGTYVLNPELPGILNALFGISVPPTPRNDLLVLVQGLPGVTQRPNEVISDQLRLNVAVPPTPAASINTLGVIAGDNAGYPNGRRLQDDVVDIALRVVAGVLIPDFNVAPNNELGDGVDGPDVPYLASFPYVADPHSGFDRFHANAAQLQSGRFTMAVTWTKADGSNGTAQAVGVAGNTQGFWFFTPDNIELTVKVLDGRAVNGHFWVFYGSMTDVAFTLTVTDTTTGAKKAYASAQGVNGSLEDTSAF